MERDSQKAIVIGKGGERLRSVGTRPASQIEALLGTPVFLDLQVKVAKDWQRDPKAAAGASASDGPARVRCSACVPASFLAAATRPSKAGSLVAVLGVPVGPQSATLRSKTVTAASIHGAAQTPSGMPIHKYPAVHTDPPARPHLARGRHRQPRARCGAASTCATATRR